MILHHDGIATVHQCWDATEQPFDLCHFQGRSTVTLNLRRCRDNELRFTSHGARELARSLDHFARTHTLPAGHWPDADWSI